MLDFKVKKVNPLTFEVEWTPVVGCMGYVFYKDGVRVSWTANPNAASTKFLKPVGSAVYAIRVLMPGETDELAFPVPTTSPVAKAEPLMPLRGGSA